MMHHDPPIISIPTGGLADRIKNIITSLQLAEKHKARIICHWVPSKECDGKFLDYFSPIPGIEFCDEEYQDTVCLEIIPGYGKRVREKHNIEWCGGITKYHRLIKPSKNILSIIEPFAEEHGLSQLPGVHARRTDKLRHHVNNKDLAAIVADFDRFFIATDCGWTQQQIVDQFGDRAIFYQKIDGAGYRQTNLEHTVVDLFLLAQCRSLISGQSFYSGFLHLARNLRNIK